MTAERTAIGRRLFVGGRAYRPPIRMGKTGHRLILAPLVAAAAATVAVGAAVALARISNGRREPPRRRRRDRLGLEADERLGTGVKRMAVGQLEVAMHTLEGPFAPDEKAVHEARKALKRLRALLRTLEGELSAEVVAREDAVLRKAADALAGARDAAVMLATLERVLLDDPPLATSKGVTRVRRRLALEQARVERDMFADAQARKDVLAELQALRARVLDWELVECDGLALVDPGLRDIYREGRRRYRRLARGRSKGMSARHRWRKEVKDLRYGVATLQRAGADGDGKDAADRMRILVRQADELAEALGEEHDLGVLVRWLKAQPRGRGSRRAKLIGRRPRRALLKLATRRRRLLRRRALREGKRLYAEKPKQFMRRAEAGFRAGEELSSR